MVTQVHAIRTVLNNSFVIAKSLQERRGNLEIKFPISLKMSKKKLEEIIRVNHAGEYGAQIIYDGQIKALKIKKDYETLKIVEHMKEQEVEHFEFFDGEIKKQKIRPTLMSPFWQVGGFALGFLTAIIDKKSAMACTTAVEEVIDEHYQEQLEYLAKEKEGFGDKEQKNISQLQEKITKFRDDEIEHKNTAYENDASDFIAFKPLSSFIKTATKFAISVSKKV